MSGPRQYVILSSIDWEAAWQRHQIFAAQLAESGRRVFFVENTGFRSPRLRDIPRLWRKVLRLLSPVPLRSTNPLPSGVTLLAPLVLPPTSPLFRRLNSAVLIPLLLRRLRAAGAGPHPAVIAYFATATTLQMIDGLDPAGVVYDCASNFRGHPDAPADFLSQEAALLSRSDLVVCDSSFLFEQKKAEHPRVVQIHQGVAPEFFDAAPASPAYRRFCYYGTWIADLDPAFLAALAGAGFDVSISGFLKDVPSSLKSVRLLPPVPRDGLVARLEGFDVFLLPHRINEFTRGVIPAKIYECLAMGRPVIAAPLPSLEPLKGLLYVARTPEEWVGIARGLPRTETGELRAARVALAREHTHAREFERFLRSVEESFRERARREEARGRP